mmetsp:Transcript_135052/g.269499  ORF Transcript_135052/g.269499 Transcript_135052/m.269499 type:complete len:233 (+) Transcript_135052:701-1399(+)
MPRVSIAAAAAAPPARCQAIRTREILPPSSCSFARKALREFWSCSTVMLRACTFSDGRSWNKSSSAVALAFAGSCSGSKKICTTDRNACNDISKGPRSWRGLKLLLGLCLEALLALFGGFTPCPSGAGLERRICRSWPLLFKRQGNCLSWPPFSTTSSAAHSAVAASRSFCVAHRGPSWLQELLRQFAKLLPSFDFGSWQGLFACDLSKGLLTSSGPPCQAAHRAGIDGVSG